MSRLAPLLPPHLVARLRAGPAIRKLPAIDEIEGSLLHVDITGFTALTERLQSAGREGAEVVAGVINRLFRKAIGAVEANDGSIASFGGDALLVLFQGAAAVRRAAASADAIARIVARAPSIHTDRGGHSIVVSQVIHHGRLRGLHLGSEARRVYLLTGPRVATLARMEENAAGGFVQLSAAARTRMAREPASFGRRPYRGAPDALLAPYVPEILVARRFERAFRRVAVLFMETRGHSAARAQSFLLHLEQVLDGYEGTLLKTDPSPDGTRWLVLFGLPEAHEDDVDRAARAAWELLRRMRGVVGVRAGLHAGTVAQLEIGTSGRRSKDVIGDTVNTAARTMGAARWGEVLVTATTARNVRNLATPPRGRRAVKGKVAPLDLHGLSKSPRTRARAAVRCPLVGRADEMAALEAAAARAEDGCGSTAGIRGDAGIGKSRLKFELAQAMATRMEVHEGRALAFGGPAYGPVAELLRSLLGLEPDAGDERTLARLDSELELAGLPARLRPPLANILGVQIEDPPVAELDADAVRLASAMALRELLYARCRERPQLWILEDLQWADDLSRHAIELLARAVGSTRALLLMLYRPPFEPPPGGTELALLELERGGVAAMLTALLGPVSASLSAIVQSRAEGNPFYVEEVCRHLEESGFLTIKDGVRHLRRAPAHDDLPDSLESLIEARLDRLSATARRVAQTGAVIGRSFPLRLLRRLPGIGTGLGRALDELRRRELLFRRSGGANPQYIFKHALTRDVAYGTILVERRRRIHRAVAEAIERLKPRHRQPHLPMLGHHWENAGDNARALPCYLAAARRAADAFAHEEAERLYESYLELERGVSPGRATARLELAERVLRVTGRFEDARRTLLRALQEARALRDRDLELAALTGIGLATSNLGELAESEQILLQARMIARSVADRRTEALVLGHLSTIELRRGRLDGAEALLDQAAIRFEELDDQRSLAIALGDRAIVQQRRGDPQAALRTFERCLALHQQRADRRFEATTLVNMASALAQAGKYDEAVELYRRGAELAERTGDVHTLAGATFGIAQVEERRGQSTSATASYARALQLYESTGAAPEIAAVRSCLSLLLLGEGRVEEALAHMEQALEILEASGDRRYAAIVRVNIASLLRLAHGQLDGAQSHLSGAIHVLREVGDRYSLVCAMCEQGHLDLALRRAPGASLDEARRLGRDLAVPSESEPAQYVEKLERAAVARRRQTFRGSRLEDVPAGLRRWLAATGQLRSAC